MTNKSVWLAVIVVTIIAIGGYVFPQVDSAIQSAIESGIFGATGTRFPNGLAVGSGASVSTAGAMVVGSSGSQKTLDKFGTCTATFTSASQSASSTVVGICTDSAFASTDQVVVLQKLTTNTGLSTGGSFPVTGILATTSGQFGVLVTNMTGAASTTINSSVYRTYYYHILR